MSDNYNMCRFLDWTQEAMSVKYGVIAGKFPSSPVLLNV